MSSYAFLKRPPGPLKTRSYCHDIMHQFSMAFNGLAGVTVNGSLIHIWEATNGKIPQNNNVIISGGQPWKHGFGHRWGTPLGKSNGTFFQGAEFNQLVSVLSNLKGQ